MRKIVYFILIGLCLTCLISYQSHAAEVVHSAADIISPEITIITPRADSAIDDAQPWIEVQMVDMGSGLQPKTIRLYLDGINVTGQALIEEIEVTGQAPVQPLRVRYQPNRALAPGMHKVIVRVQDKAGNLAECRWNFQMSTGQDRGIGLSGVNTLQIEEYPIRQITDNVDLDLQAWLGHTKFRINQQGNITNYPAGSPDFIYKGYNIYNTGYTVGITHQNVEALWGNVTVPLDSELLQMDPAINGSIVNGQVGNDTGNYQFAVFSGDVGSTSGLGIAIYQCQGIVGFWQSQSGLQLESFGLRFGDDFGSYYLGLKGSMAVRQLLVRFETIYGSLDDTAGNALALHLDQPVGPAYLGFDYILFQPDYPTTGTPTSFSLDENNGSRRYALRTNLRLSKNQALRFQGSFTEDNLNHSAVLTRYRKNYYVDYQMQPAVSSVLNLNYQEDYRYQNNGFNRVDPDQTKSILAGYQQQYRNVTFNTSITSSHENNAGEISATKQYLLSCTYPVSTVNLTPSISWQQDQDKYCENVTEMRVTVDFGWNPELSRNKVALFHRIRNEERNNSMTKTHETGWEATLNLKTGNHSSFILTYDNSLWEDEEDKGTDRTLRLEWRVQF